MFEIICISEVISAGYMTDINSHVGLPALLHHEYGDAAWGEVHGGHCTETGHGDVVWGMLQLLQGDVHGGHRMGMVHGDTAAAPGQLKLSVFQGCCLQMLALGAKQPGKPVPRFLPFCP